MHRLGEGGEHDHLTVDHLAAWRRLSLPRSFSPSRSVSCEQNKVLMEISILMGMGER